MQHKGTRELRTERLVLRRVGPADAEEMYANWASDPEVTRFLTWAPHASVEETRELLASWEASYARDDWYQWGITLAGPGTLVGTVSVVEVFEDIDCCEVGYCIGRPWWGQGIMTEALAAVRDFLLGEVGVARLCAYHDPRNPASGAVMAKCGLRFEGIWRAGGRDATGEPVDLVCRALLASDLPQEGTSEQEQRIAQGESCLTHVEAANTLLELACGEHDAARADYEQLAAYYGSRAWHEDLAADDAGTLPAKLRRGVLSQDAAYDALTSYDRLAG